MTKMLDKITVIACLATPQGAFAFDAVTPGATTDELSHHDAIHWVDVAQIEKGSFSLCVVTPSIERWHAFSEHASGQFGHKALA